MPCAQGAEPAKTREGMKVMQRPAPGLCSPSAYFLRPPCMAEAGRSFISPAMVGHLGVAPGSVGALNLDAEPGAPLFFFLKYALHSRQPCFQFYLSCLHLVDVCMEHLGITC